eukprot:COSAG06_NODE_3828_length_4861_cov_4.239605_3_plen_175_part_00
MVSRAESFSRQSPDLFADRDARHAFTSHGGPAGTKVTAVQRTGSHQTRLLTCWCLRGLTPSIRLGRLDFCPWQSSIFRQSPTFMLKIRRRLDAHEPHELPCYGLTQKLHGRVTNPAYLCTRSTMRPQHQGQCPSRSVYSTRRPAASSPEQALSVALSHPQLVTVALCFRPLITT